MQVLLLFLTSLFLFSSTSCADAKPLTGFSIDLIHRDSPLSPFYNSSMTSSELLRNAALRSISRINRFGFENEAAETIIIPKGGEYLMKIFIGTPSVEFMAVADTGSDLIWVPCLPCGQCNPQSSFDPNQSSTFTVLPCSSQQCSFLDPNPHDCGTSSQCSQTFILEAVQNPPNPYKLCFENKSSMQNPSLVFHFTGADVTLPPQNMFRDVGENLFCFLAVPTENLPIFGNIAQNDFLVEYDLEGKKVSFAPADCTKQ